MIYPLGGMDNRKQGSVAETFDESLSEDLFNLLWGQERSAMPTVVDYAYKEIWKRVIMIGGSEEQRLSDMMLAEQLGMSRTPVRQALERLVQEGLVRSDPRRGFWTRTFTAQDIHEIYDLRGALEVLALRLKSMICAAPWRCWPSAWRLLVSAMRTSRHISRLCMLYVGNWMHTLSYVFSR